MLCHAGGYEILLCNVQGEYHAIENRCSHQNKPLTGGRLMGSQITCPFHSATFDVRTGAATGFPASRPLKNFATRINGGVIEVALGI